MSRKPVPAQSGDRSRTELVFDRPQLMAQLFGEFDQNLLALENKPGVYITARGNKVGLEGSAEAVA
ncbi:phosphate starvation-inducible protein PhoH, partial [Salmonella enterica subsp. enterica serovar 4:-:1,2]|nr:phosphate starvation-inducible protein PhoH [Salmonella enterica subsp. enterica serovar 4:-:1,2]